MLKWSWSVVALNKLLVDSLKNHYLFFTGSFGKLVEFFQKKSYIAYLSVWICSLRDFFHNSLIKMKISDKA